MSAESSDATIIEQSIADPHAFSPIFERHFDAVYRYAQRRLGPSLGEEIAAETFVRAFDRRAAFDLTRVDARPWLFGIAANLMRRHWRTERRRLQALGRLEGGSSDLLPPERIDLAAALNSIPAREREALLLYALADLTYEEIGDALGLPVGTVRSRLSRARDRIRRHLEVIPEGAL